MLPDAPTAEANKKWQKLQATHGDAEGTAHVAHVMHAVNGGRLSALRCPSDTRSQIYALAGAKVAKDHYTDGMRAKEAWCRRPPQSRCVTDARRVLGSPIRVTYVSRLFQMLEESMQTQYSLRPHTLVA